MPGADVDSAQSSRKVKVVIHEIRHREFTLDLDAMCDDYLWPSYVDDSEISEVLEHSDTWRELRDGEIPKWLTEKLPNEGWREVYEIEREPGEDATAGVCASRSASQIDHRPEYGDVPGWAVPSSDPRNPVAGRDIGWRCGPCGWETFDLADMHKFVNWREPDGSISMVCPSCGAEGQFVDAERGT